MKWHHSLYWRIAAGFVGCLALLLVVQAVLFVWVVARSGRSVPNQPPERLAQTIALDAANAIERDPAIDIKAYLQREYSDAQPFFVLFADGARVEIGGPFESQMIEDSKLRFDAMRQMDPAVGRGRGRGFGPGFPPGGPGFGPGFSPDERGGPPPFRPDGPGGAGASPDRSGPGNEPPDMPRGPRGERGGPPRPVRPAPIVANGQWVGLVVVPPEPQFAFLLRRYAPLLGSAAIVTLVLGALIAAIVIFGPARTRLRAVEAAARRLGAGDLSARAPSRGNDEVSAVATAFNAMAADLSARAEALAASDKARRQLLADVSHELTTPVTAIRGYLETLNMPALGLDAATRARYLGIIGDETARLEHIIGDLLDLARLEGGGGALHVETVNTGALFERVVARHERAAVEAGVSFRTSIASDAATVRGDRARLEQALQNLTANALRYAPHGSAIDLRARADRQRIVLSIADAGPGIAPEHLPHIFDRFYRAEASRIRQGTASQSGSGLGLSIVKAIVERHGGTISVASEPGRTVFEIAI